MTQIHPWRLAVPQAELDGLRERLRLTRLPERETVGGWEQGVPRDRLVSLLDYWQNDYDWRRCETRLNALGQYRTELDGLDIHFLHVRSRHEGALPIILTHGWPGSVIEFLKVIGPLTDPEAFGGQACDAFHVVVPSLPGFGFSGKPAATGWGVERIARCWIDLMARLGYDHYVAQGGDWGSSVTIQMGLRNPDPLRGIHLNMVSAKPADLREPLDAEEASALRKFRHYNDLEAGYARQQATRPQTLGYGLADSPAGQAAWIYEKLRAWSDCNGDPESVFTRDEMLDNIMLYWLPNTAASSARLYHESMHSFRPYELALPVGISNFPHEIIPIPRKWADRVFPQIIHWGNPARGGHFAAFEQPGLFVEELRTCFAKLR